ncbi:MAG TPA: IS66 family insertion sequence element accessory protein TnpB [Caulobacteraceae bacterium]|nr:IS66 family insertion sequence element accessory protein TnpB [Caulobacteraceae bacterium]
MNLAAGTRVWLACEPVSMREGFDGLAAQVANVLKADRYCGAVCLFRSRRGDYLKALHWDGSGLVLYAKRLEQGRFCWPAKVTEGEERGRRAAGFGRA